MSSPFIPREQRDGAETHETNPQGWATQRRFSELRRGHPPDETASRSWRSRILPVAIFGFFTLGALQVFQRLLKGEGP